jgi:D-alanyl-lipoteichoic acid acyltransferase DltB (MBOAT superfamily)
LVVADNVALIVDRVLASPTQESGGSLTATFAMYSFQLYFDFLGYTTIAIGVARLFEVQLSQNFDRPYGSTSLRDFWRRWHITLSSWFRDYIYVPLGGKATRGLSRVGQMLVVFFVSGLWHGAGLNFLAWGGFHGTAYVLEEHLRKRRDNGNSQSAGRDRLSSWGRLAITFSIVTVAWVFFRLSDFSEIHAVFERIFFINTDVPYWSINPVLMQADSLIFLGILLTGIALDSSRQARVMVEWVPTKRREIATELVFVNWLVVTLVLVGNQGSRDFVYFRF